MPLESFNISSKSRLNSIEEFNTSRLIQWAYVEGLTPYQIRSYIYYFNIYLLSLYRQLSSIYGCFVYACACARSEANG